MPLDPEVRRAVTKAVEDSGQPPKVAKRIVVWLTEMSESELSAGDNEDHLKAIYRGLDLTAEDTE